jgi:thiol-disulfide isomerase/thioredoxin
MKKIYLFALALFLSVNCLKAQTTLTTAVDFTVTDTHGNSHNLFSILASGKYVCLDFFFVTCPACIATCPYYKQTFTNYGCNTQDVYFMSIDNGDSNVQCDQYETDHLGGSAGYPCISGATGGGNAVVSTYGISAFPTYILIKPDHSIVEGDMWPINSAADFDTYFAAHALTHKSCLTGIKEEAYTNSIFLYPNPASDHLKVETSNNIKVSTVKVFDVLGKNIISLKLNDVETAELNVAELERGIYFMEIVTSDEHTIVKKFNKQ